MPHVNAAHAHAHPHRDSADIVAASPEGAQGLARVVDFVDAHINRYGSAPEPRFYLSGADIHERVELTQELFTVLKAAAEELGKGRSISILAREQEISTQQAADLLGLSRPTVVRLIEDGELAATVPGRSRRKLRLADVLKYRDLLHARRTEFISESSEEFSDVGEHPEKVAESLEKARHAR